MQKTTECYLMSTAQVNRVRNKYTYCHVQYADTTDYCQYIFSRRAGGGGHGKSECHMVTQAK
jgi:hypothetical protein